MSDDLKPCPFCGEPEVEAYTTKGGFVVGCTNADCLAEGPWDLGESGAIAKWNERSYHE
jgi:Lar family restriction alleviation protein